MSVPLLVRQAFNERTIQQVKLFDQLFEATPTAVEQPLIKKTLEMDPNYFLARLYASRAYTDKEMYSEAISEARKAIELSGGKGSHSFANLGYALAKYGKRSRSALCAPRFIEVVSQPPGLGLQYRARLQRPRQE